MLLSAKKSYNHLQKLPWDYVAIILGAILFLGLYVRNFWALDDLWMLARVSEHFYSGNGLVWNYGEKVQVSTSVLWQWCLILTHGITGKAEPYIQIMILHSIFAVILLGIIYWRWNKGRYFLLTVLLLAGSNIVIDYTSGGLENGLAYVFVAAIWAMTMRGVRLQWILLVFGIALLVRHDLILLLGPAVAWAVWENRSNYSKVTILKYAILASIPLLAWSVFAWTYYGSPLPSAAFERSGIPLGYDWHGYWISTFKHDAWAMLILLLGSVLVFWKGESKHKALFVGIVLYITYASMVIAPFNVVLGRLLTSMALLGILVFVDCITIKNINTAICIGLTMISMIVWGVVLSQHTPVFPNYNAWGIEDIHEITGIIINTEEIRRDSRYILIHSSIPSMKSSNWNRIHSKSSYYAEYNKILDAWNNGNTVYDHKIGMPEYIFSYYVPLQMVIIDNFHSKSQE